MADKLKIVYEGSQAEIVEKKSRFIAYVKPVNSEEEATSFIESIKKQNWDAKHNCSAVVIGEHNEFSRCNDDGEPSSTAGKPMLEVLINEGVHNVAVVVTRYFGGILLGTGGLVRAYQKATKEGLAAATIIEKQKGFEYTVRTDYNGIGKIQYIVASLNINTLDTLYTEDVLVKVVVPDDIENEFVKKITEGTNGKAVIEKVDEYYYGVIEGEVKRF